MSQKLKLYSFNLVSYSYSNKVRLTFFYHGLEFVMTKHMLFRFLTSKFPMFRLYANNPRKYTYRELCYFLYSHRGSYYDFTLSVEFIVK